MKMYTDSLPKLKIANLSNYITNTLYSFVDDTEVQLFFKKSVLLGQIYRQQQFGLVVFHLLFSPGQYTRVVSLCKLIYMTEHKLTPLMVSARSFDSQDY